MDVGRGAGQRADMAAEQVNLAIPDDHVGLLDLRTTGTDRLDFPSFEDDSGFETVFE